MRRSEGVVWVPEHGRLVLDTEVPDLAGAVARRLRTAARQASLWAVYGVLLAVMFGMAGAPTLPPLVLFVLPAVASIFDALSERRGLARRQRGIDPWFPDIAGRFQLWLATQRATFTMGWLGAIALCGMCQLVAGLDESVTAAGLVKDQVRAGEPWRLLTGTLLHGGAWHFIVNTAALASLGYTTEALIGRGRTALVTMASLLGGSVASLWLLPHADSVGASGGLMGLIGALLVVGHRRRDVLPPGFVRSLVRSVLWVAAAGAFGHAFIDNAAHAGGLLAGTAAGAALSRSGTSLPLPDRRPIEVAGVVAMATLAAAALGTAALLLRGFAA